MTTLTLNFQSLTLSDRQFFQLCQNNRDLRFERNANGDVIIMSPTGGETSNRNIEIAYQLQAWSRQSKLGVAFDSSGGFKLPNGANRSPDAAWLPLHKWEALTSEERAKFLPLCPDFVIELRSPSDNLATLQQKMVEYRDNGTRLGWLIDRESRRVEIYRDSQNKAEVLESPTSLSGENVLPRFVLELQLVLQTPLSGTSAAIY